MTSFRIYALVLISCVCYACAGGGPAQPEQPKHVRQSIRYQNKGVALYTKGCYPKALEYFQDAHERYTAADNLEGIGNSLHSIANIYFRLEQWESALLVYDDAIEAYGLSGESLGLVRLLCDKTAALIAADRLEDAAATLDKADQAASGADYFPAQRLKTRALLLIRQNAFAEARVMLDKALSLVAKEDLTTLAGIHYTMGHLLLLERQPEQALTQFKRPWSPIAKSVPIMTLPKTWRPWGPATPRCLKTGKR